MVTPNIRREVILWLPVLLPCGSGVARRRLGIGAALALLAGFIAWSNAGRLCLPLVRRREIRLERMQSDTKPRGKEFYSARKLPAWFRVADARCYDC